MVRHSPSLPTPLSVFVLCLTSCFFLQFFSGHKTLLLVQNPLIPSFFCYRLCLHFIVSPLLAQIDFALNKMKVCQSPFVTSHSSIHLFLCSSPLFMTSQFFHPTGLWKSREQLVSLIPSVSIKLKYSCARYAPCNSRWCRLVEDSQFPWQPSPSIPPPLLAWLRWVV